MAVVSLRKNTWDNADGLRVYFPGTGTGVTRGGEVNEAGRHWTEAVIDLTALPTVASGNQQIIAENVTIPSGALIEEVHVVTSKAATSGGAATLDIGLVDQDRSTEIDFNGLVAAAAKTTIDAVGETTVYRVGSAGAGALVGTRLTNTGLLTANAGTADFTAGKVIVRVMWSVPLSADV